VVTVSLAASPRFWATWRSLSLCSFFILESLDEKKLIGCVRDFSGTGIGGTIPTNLSLLKKLSTLNLASSSLSGTIPAELGNMTALKNLDLTNNSLTGSLPRTLSKLSPLATLKISSTQIGGCWPYVPALSVSGTWYAQSFASIASRRFRKLILVT